ncbi:MAG: Lpg1974 family pore-forming outer membrane protein [Gammaproteobacteria bacterium]
MLNLKKTAVAVLALSSSAAFAGTMGPVCSAVPVTMPCESTGWEVGARALWYNLGAGNQNVTLTAGGTTGSGSVSTNVNPEFAWGFQINGSMLYGTGRSVSLDWYHVKHTVNGPTGTQTLVGNEAFVTGQQTLRGNYISALTVTSRSSSASPEFDSVNMIFGQHVDFSEVTSANLGWGWNWSRVGSNNNVAQAGSATPVVSGVVGTATPYDFTASNSQTFNGFGPEVALRGDYGLIDSLNIYARGSFAALAGFSKTSLTYTDVTSTSNVSASNSVVTIVPVVDGKLGLSWDWDMPSFAKVVLDVNYDFGTYINALRNNSIGGGVTGSNASSFEYQGIAFGLDLVFAS